MGANLEKLKTINKNKAKRMDKLAPASRFTSDASFVAAYDAAKQSWIGSLSIEGQIFTSVNKGVFGLMTRLDKLYRAWLARKPDDGRPLT